MTSTIQDPDDFDFHASGIPDAENSRVVFEAFLESKKSANLLPKIYHTEGFDLTVHRILKGNLHKGPGNTRLFRKRADANETLASYWLARVSEAAYFFEAWRNLPSYVPISKDFLNEFARLSENPQNISSTEELLASQGIIVIHEKAIPGMKIDGACFLLPTGRPVIALSLRYSRLDIYWFVLMHELAHVAMHYEKLLEPIIDNIDEEDLSDTEVEANLIAANSLIPRSIWRSANVKYNSSVSEIFALAKAAKTHPAVVAGRLQRETGRHQVHADIVNSVNTRQLIFGHE